MPLLTSDLMVRFYSSFVGVIPTWFRRKVLEHWAESWWWLCPTPVVTAQKPILRVPPLLPYVFPISNIWWGILQTTECIQRWEFIQSKKNFQVALRSSSLVPARDAVLLGWDKKFLHVWFSVKDCWVIFQCVPRITRATAIGSRCFDNGHTSLLGFLQYNASFPPS